jgi:hypothetical protein
MATQNAFGLRWLGINKQGAPGFLTQYGKPASDTNPIYMNDVVMKTSTSAADPAGGNPAPGCQGGNLGTAGTGPWLGTSLNFGAANTLTMHSVVDDPNAIFLTQSDSAAAETTTAIVGMNANLNVSGGAHAQLGNALTKQSGMSLSSASITTTASKDVRILGLFDNPAVNPDNAAYPILEVQIVLHQYNPGTVGV